MNQDALVDIGSSRIQYGPSSNRIYLMHYHREDCPRIIKWIDRKQKEAGYSKHFLKIPAADAPGFLARGYRLEAVIPGYFSGNGDAHLLVKYFDTSRERLSSRDQDALSALSNSQPPVETPSLPRDFPSHLTHRPAEPSDAAALAELYGAVFSSYPFPISNPSYLRQTMDQNVTYWLAEDSAGNLAAAASAERDAASKSAEMTDFAVLPNHRGQKLSLLLLSILEARLREENFHTVYTIARLAEAGMNRTFQKAGYQYGGTLRNNTQIAGRLESMNIWHKPL